MKRKQKPADPSFIKSFKYLYIVSLILVGLLAILLPDALTTMSSIQLIGMATLVVFFYTPFAIVALQEKSSIVFPWDHKVVLDSVTGLAWNMMHMILTLLLTILLWDALSFASSLQSYLKILLANYFIMGVGKLILAYPAHLSMASQCNIQEIPNGLPHR